ncbi:MAG TPA: transglycosylase domain-containing protein [Polyangiales bacterium]|nr:transglycosylase domain-containing protein [Polyangiales bacterium]
MLARARCSPLSIVDRYGRSLRELPGDCAPYGRANWTPLAAIPPILTRMLIASEDRRFEQHSGVDVRAIARATWTNLRARKVVSGASTLTMQLARMLEQVQPIAASGAPPVPRTTESRSSSGAWLNKLSRAWTALALERRLSKDEILEAYVNLAYYGAGAYGLDAASRTYFGKSVAALSDAESSVLAVLPRAPGAYDLRYGLARAQHRRNYVLTLLSQRGELDDQTRRTLLSSPITVATQRAASTTPAGHFVDYLLATLPDPARRSGGTLHTSLDLGLQTTLERIVAEHVASLSDRGVNQAGLVVLDTDTGAIRAMVGSRAYDASQINITARRRQLGSLLKPFVYALAIEAGETPASVALDVGDTSPDFRTRDWVGREAGPLSYKEALAGSYNLAAIHVLERVGVPALHARLRKAGVGELPSAPARYGLMLALGSARVRLLDVASGYGFLVRGGLSRPAHAIDILERSDGSSWRPTPTADRALFSEHVSWQVMDMLSDSAARHRRFGVGLPLDAASPVAAKTGTASGLSDLSAILATREYIVAAWAGRFDGEPTHGASGMWAAAPLASRALVAALGGRQPTLPPRPTELAVRGDTTTGATRAELPPAELEPWAERARALAGHKRATEAR